MISVKELTIDFDKSVEDVSHFCSIPYISVSTAPKLEIEVVTKELATFDLYGLIDSLEGNGETYIINCTCGEPGCMGINSKAKVIHNDEYIEMYVPEPILKNFRFKKNDLSKAIVNVLKDICDHYQLVLNKDGFLGKKNS